MSPRAQLVIFCFKYHLQSCSNSTGVINFTVIELLLTMRSVTLMMTTLSFVMILIRSSSGHRLGLRSNPIRPYTGVVPGTRYAVVTTTIRLRFDCHSTATALRPFDDLCYDCTPSLPTCLPKFGVEGTLIYMSPKISACCVHMCIEM